MSAPIVKPIEDLGSIPNFATDALAKNVTLLKYFLPNRRILWFRHASEKRLEVQVLILK